jgi:hypothetical protein
MLKEVGSIRRTMGSEQETLSIDPFFSLHAALGGDYAAEGANHPMPTLRGVQGCALFSVDESN